MAGVQQEPLGVQIVMLQHRDLLVCGVDQHSLQRVPDAAGIISSLRRLGVGIGRVASPEMTAPASLRMDGSEPANTSRAVQRILPGRPCCTPVRTGPAWFDTAIPSRNHIPASLMPVGKHPGISVNSRPEKAL